MWYVHYWLSIRCYSLPPPPSAGPIPFDHLQISSDWLSHRINQFHSSCISLQCKETGVHPLLAHHLLLYSSHSGFPSRSDQFRTFGDQLGLTCWQAQSIRLVEYIETRQGCCGTSIIGSRFTAVLLHLLFLLLPGWPRFDHLQINSERLTGRHHRVGLSSTSWWCNQVGVYAVLTGQRGRTEIQTQLIFSSYNNLHTLSFCAFALTRTCLDFVYPSNCVDPHGWVVSYHLARLHCWSQSPSFS